MMLPRRSTSSITLSAQGPWPALHGCLHWCWTRKCCTEGNHRLFSTLVVHKDTASSLPILTVALIIIHKYTARRRPSRFQPRPAQLNIDRFTKKLTAPRALLRLGPFAPWKTTEHRGGGAA